LDIGPYFSPLVLPEYFPDVMDNKFSWGGVGGEGAAREFSYKLASDFLNNFYFVTVYFLRQVDHF
jgi:hypothetical protein